jgi:predicted transcriptional regulator
MTDLLEKAVAAARALPPDLQDEIAHVVLMIAADAHSDPIALSDAERAAIAASRAAAARGEFATDEQVRAVWAKYGG